MKAVLLSLTIALAACSTTSTEVYTERRVLTYPKGQTPHMKELLVQPQHQEQNVYTGVNDPRPADDYDSLFAPVPEPQDHWSNPDIPATTHELERENYYLGLMARNKMLKSML